MAGEHDRRALLVAWDEAREVLVVVLLIAALLYVAAPMILYAVRDLDGRAGTSLPLLSWWDLSSALVNVNAVAGLLLLGAGVSVCTTLAIDMVPRLRQCVFWLSVAVTALAGLTIINMLTTSFPLYGLFRGGNTVALRLSAVLALPAPAALLAGAAAWMARRVVLFG